MSEPHVKAQGHHLPITRSETQGRFVQEDEKGLGGGSAGSSGEQGRSKKVGDVIVHKIEKEILINVLVDPWT